MGKALDPSHRDPSGNARQSCPVSRNCGGCTYASVPYSEQLKKKEKTVRDLLSGICTVRPIVGAKDPLFYRNKVHWAFGHISSPDATRKDPTGSSKMTTAFSRIKNARRSSRISVIWRSGLRSALTMSGPVRDFSGESS